MVETINLDLVPNRIAQFIKKTPVEILIENGRSVYNNTINNISTSRLSTFEGSSENTVHLDNDTLLFANTYDSVDIYSKLASSDVMALIGAISNKISQFKFEEDVTVFNVDKILTNRPHLLKITEQREFKVDYIISSSLPVLFSVNSNRIRISGDDISVSEVNEYYLKSLIRSEINNSLVMIKISENSNVDVGEIMRKLAQYSTLIHYNKSLRVISIKMNLVVDLRYEFMHCYKGPRLREIITIDRTKWLSD